MVFSFAWTAQLLSRISLCLSCWPPSHFVCGCRWVRGLGPSLFARRYVCVAILDLDSGAIALQALKSARKSFKLITHTWSDERRTLRKEKENCFALLSCPLFCKYTYMKSNVSLCLVGVILGDSSGARQGLTAQIIYESDVQWCAFLTVPKMLSSSLNFL